MNKPKMLTAIISGFALLACVFCWPAGSTAAMQERGQGTRLSQAGRYYALLIAVQKYRDPKIN
ncbi:MAG: hypothetical protein AAB401_14790, partial [Acidobacteriota bacterium]